MVRWKLYKNVGQNRAIYKIKFKVKTLMCNTCLKAYSRSNFFVKILNSTNNYLNYLKPRSFKKESERENVREEG